MSTREQLAEALQLWDSDRADRIAALITPLVEQIATERAASELREAALDPERLQVLMHGVVPTYVIPQGRLFARADALTDRAAVLRSQSHTDKGDQA
jgi:hypothetical protein